MIVAADQVDSLKVKVAVLTSSTEQIHRIHRNTLKAAGVLVNQTKRGVGVGGGSTGLIQW